jgi:hypothetical protein
MPEAMSSIPPEEMQRAKQALDKLVQRYIHHPQVSLIDMGLDPYQVEGERVVLRVHLRGPLSEKTPVLPDEVDGIPVIRLSGDYRPEG